MNLLTFFWNSSIGKKWLVAITGLIWVGYVVGHMAGNLQVFAGAETINAYAAMLHSMPALLWVARIVLIVAFVLHIVMTIRVTKENREARPERYQHNNRAHTKVAARTMIFSGLILLSFVIYHLLHLTLRSTDSRFKPVAEGGALMHENDVFSMLVLSFQSPLVSIFYLISIALLCMHLSHGLSSMLQTFGLNTRKTMPGISLGARAAAALIFLGYASIPLSVWFGVLKLQPHPSPVPVAQIH